MKATFRRSLAGDVSMEANVALSRCLAVGASMTSTTRQE